MESDQRHSRGDGGQRGSTYPVKLAIYKLLQLTRRAELRKSVSGYTAQIGAAPSHLASFAIVQQPHKGRAVASKENPTHTVIWKKIQKSRRTAEKVLKGRDIG
jgi:hypothetical protein